MMKRKKPLGVAAIAVLALAALVTAVSASAEGESPIGYFFSGGEFQAESYPIKVAAKDSGNTRIMPEGGYGGGIGCSVGEYLMQGEQTKATTNPPVLDFEYTGCTVGSSYTATVETNGCTWTFENPFKNARTVHLICPKEKEVVGKVYNSKSELKCTYTIPPQGPLSGINFENAGSGSERSVTTTFHIAGLHNTTSGSLLACSGAPNGTHTNGILQGYFDLKDYWSLFP